MRHYRAVFICSLFALAAFSGYAETAAPAGDAAARERAARIAAAIDDRLLAAQVIISGVDGRERLGRDIDGA